MEGLLWILLTSVGDVAHKKGGHWFNRYYWSVVPELGFSRNSAANNLPANMEDMGDPVPSHSWEDSLEKEMVTHALFLPRDIDRGLW